MTDCKQLTKFAEKYDTGCELLSNFVSLTDCKQHELYEQHRRAGCELLSNFVSLTDCKQHTSSIEDEPSRCELLSNFVSLTDCKQQDVCKINDNNDLGYVCRIKNPAAMSDFLFVFRALKEF